MTTSLYCPNCNNNCTNKVRCWSCSHNFACSDSKSYCARKCDFCAEKEKKNSLSKLSMDLEPQNGRHYSTIFLSKTIEVLLSPPRAKTTVSYHLHVDKLRQSADYFSLLFTFQGKEVTENKITLSEPVDDPEAFKYFVQYIYCDDYLIPEAYEPYTALLHAMVYVLAERLQALKLRALAMEKLTAYLTGKGRNTSEKVVIKMVKAVYGGTCSYDSSYGGTVGEKKRTGSEEKNEAAEAETPDGGDSASAAAADALADFDLDDDSDSDSDIKPINPLRTLVTRYAASKLDSLRKQPNFRALIKEIPQFAEDIMLEAQNGQFTV